MITGSSLNSPCNALFISFQNICWFSSHTHLLFVNFFVTAKCVKSSFTELFYTLNFANWYFLTLLKLSFNILHWALNLIGVSLSHQTKINCRFYALVVKSSDVQIMCSSSSSYTDRWGSKCPTDHVFKCTRSLQTKMNDESKGRSLRSTLKELWQTWTSRQFTTTTNLQAMAKT